MLSGALSMMHGNRLIAVGVMVLVFNSALVASEDAAEDQAKPSPARPKSEPRVISRTRPNGADTSNSKIPPPTPTAFMLPQRLQLTPEQTKKYEEIKAEYGKKLENATKKVSDVFTKEQLEARQRARREALATRKKNGTDVKAAIDAAVKLSDEQQKKLDLAEKELKELTKEIRKKINALMTEEQKKALVGQQ